MGARRTNRSLSTERLLLRHAQPQVLTSRLLALVACPLIVALCSVFVPPEGCGANAGLVGKCGRCRREADGRMVRCNGCGATFHRECVALMRVNRPGMKARTGQPWCCLGCEQSDGPTAGDPLRISEFCAGTGSLA